MVKHSLAVFSFFVVIALCPNTYSQVPDQSELKAQGIKLYKEGNYELSAKTLQSYLKKSKDDPDGWYYLGLANHRLVKVKDARKSLDKALKLKPDNPNILSALAYMELLSGNTKSALLKAKMALKLDAKNTEALYVLGSATLQEGNNSEAKSYLTELLKLNDKHAPGWLLLSQLCLDEFRKDIGEKWQKDKTMVSDKRYFLKEAAVALESFLKYSTDAKSNDFWKEQLETLRIHGNINSDAENEQAIFPVSKVDARPQITYKEKAAYSEVAKRNGVQGAVLLRCILHKDGTIKHILVLKGLPLGLTESAVLAAKNIKFIPAVKNGQPVSVSVSIEYNFNLY